MILDPVPTLIRFRCNVCDTENVLPTRTFHRELATCRVCQCNVRARGIVYGICTGVFGHACPRLSDLPDDSGRVGLGMSEFHFVDRLNKKVTFTNTYFHQEPKLDILSDQDWLHFQDQDFVVSTDIFEHIRQPLQTAYTNVANMLKPGGCFIFSAPYIDAPSTIEHYPNLHEYTIEEASGHRELVNTTAGGAVERFSDPIFHGGDGSTLELRVLARSDIFSGLAAAGFIDIREYSEPVLDIGYYWPDMTYTTAADERGNTATFPQPAYIIVATKAA